MGEFFHGWRRKAGCVALFMACALMGGWVRSKTFDYIEQIQFGDNRFHSFDGKFEWYKKSYAEIVMYSASNGDGTTTNAMVEVNDPIFVVWYLFVTIPLTFLSAYLILWKPRKRKAESDA